jgi:NTP pyrophosphatase (non-canonical NTP hydrolase)
MSALFNIFPRLRFVDENSIHDQVVHVMSEANEVCDAVIMGESWFRMAEELVDVIASSVTGLRILSEEYGVDVDDVVDHVNAKNAARCYLAGASRPEGTHSGSTGCALPASPSLHQDKESCSNRPIEEGR